MQVKMTTEESLQSCNSHVVIQPDDAKVASATANDGRCPPEGKTEQEEVVRVLTKSIVLLSKLANLDHSIYRSTLAGSTTSGNDVDQDNDDLFLSFEKENPDKDASDLQRRLEVIQREWKLEDTSIPQLAQAIHRLQSNTNTLARESDRQTMEIQSLQNQLHTRNQRVDQLEQAVHKLHRQNKKLKEKLLAKRIEKKSIVKNVKEYVSQVNSARRKESDLTLEEERVAQQLRAHEQLLRMERELHTNKGSLDNGDGEGGGDTNRSRFNTFDSIDTFTDLDLVLGGDSPIATIDSNHNGGGGEEEEADGGSLSELIEDDFRSRTSSTGSLLEQGVATIRYSPMNSPKDGSDTAELHTALDSSIGASDKNKDDKSWTSMKEKFAGVGTKDIFKKTTSEKSAQVYTVSYQPGSEIGLQFHRTPFDRTEKKQVLITGAMLESVSAETENENKTNGADKKSAGIKKNPISFQLDGFRRRKIDNEKTTATTKEGNETEFYAFLVCGFRGFDTQHNNRPILGARLVGIDDIALDDENWTASRLKQTIDACLSSGISFSLSFRNDSLSKKQNDTILKAAKIAEESSLIIFETRVEKDSDNVEKINCDQSCDGQISRKDPLRRILNIQTGPVQSKVPPLEDVTKSGGLEEPVTHESQQQPAVAGTPPSTKFKKSMTNFWKQTKEQLKGNPLYD